MTSNEQAQAAAAAADAFRAAEDALASLSSRTAEGGDESKVLATCAMDGRVVDLRISGNFINRVGNEQLSAAVCEAIQSAQEAVARGRAEAASGGPASIEELGQRLAAATQEMSKRMAEIQQKAERINRGMT